MRRHFRRAVVGGILLAVPLVACKDVLEVNIQGQITEENANSPAGADALRVGAYHSFAFRNGAVTGTILTDISNYGQVLWSGMLTDEFVNRNTTGNAVVAIDRRDGVGGGDYGQMHQIRARARQAIEALALYQPLVLRPRGQMWFIIGYTEMQFAEMFCAGVPLSRSTGGVTTYGSPLTRTQMYDSALAHFDSALAYLGDAADTAAVNLNTATRIAKHVR